MPLYKKPDKQHVLLQATVLGELAGNKLKTWLWLRADLSNSDKTDGFLKKQKLSPKVISQELSFKQGLLSSLWLVWP
jgi:hypothetical protein